MNWLKRRSPATLYITFFLGFVVLRAVSFSFTTAGEYRLYRDYGNTARTTSYDELYRTRDIEYPHLAIAFGVVVGVVADHLPEWTTHLVGWRPNKYEPFYLSETDEEHDRGDRYEVALGLVLFAADLACLGLVYLIARSIYPFEGHLTRVARLLGYAVATGAMGLILYDRQDLVVSLFALAALLTLTVGRPRVGYAILMVGCAFKLVPVLLLPLWVMACASVRTAPNATPVRYLRCVIIEAMIAGLILSLWPVISHEFGGGRRAFLFLTYHADRGLQLEAPIAWPVLLIDPSTEVGHGYGSFNLRGQLADEVAKPTRLLMVLSLVLGLLLALRGYWRAASCSCRLSYPDIVPHTVAASLLIWLGFITTNKVGSPQYLIWIAPLIVLLPLRNWGERGWALLMFVAILCTSAIFPCAYPAIIGPEIKSDPLTWAGPTAGGIFLLALRSVVLSITTLWLAVEVLRNPHVEINSDSQLDRTNDNTCEIAIRRNERN